MYQVLLVDWSIFSLGAGYWWVVESFRGCWAYILLPHTSVENRTPPPTNSSNLWFLTAFSLPPQRQLASNPTTFCFRFPRRLGIWVGSRLASRLTRLNRGRGGGKHRGGGGLHPGDALAVRGALAWALGSPWHWLK